MSEHVGHELKALRESKGLTLEQAAEDTRLRAGLLAELEESRTAEDFPDIYRKLSLRAYARYLGLPFETNRRKPPKSKRARLSAVGLFVRRMGRPPKPPRLSPAQRNRLVGVAKITSAAVVTVLAIGLWSLNAKLSRLNIDDTKPRAPIVIPAAEAAPLPVVIDKPHCTLEEPVQLSLIPGE